MEWRLAFNAVQWTYYDLFLLITMIVIILFWMVIVRFKHPGILWWMTVGVVLFILGGGSYTSRVQALKLDQLLNNSREIEIIQGAFAYGDYYFPHSADYDVDYREISIGEKRLRLYPSDYLKSNRCYRKFYRHNTFQNVDYLRLHIYWYDYSLDYKGQSIGLKTPCILKIETKDVI